MLFLIFQIQNSYDQESCVQDNHKFFICTHKPHSFLQDSETEWQRILPVAWVSILYCQCAFWQICQFIIFFSFILHISTHSVFAPTSIFFYSSQILQTGGFHPVHLLYIRRRRNELQEL